MVRLVSVGAAVVLMLALARWPYGYYQFLRVFVFFAGIFVGVVLRQSSDGTKQNLSWALFATALIFNPLLPVHLPREIWSVLNIAGAGVFAYSAYVRGYSS